MPILTTSVNVIAPARREPAFTHGSGEGGDLGALRLDRRHDVLAVDTNRRAGKIAQGHVQGRTPFSDVDLRRRTGRRGAPRVVRRAPRSNKWPSVAWSGGFSNNQRSGRRGGRKNARTDSVIGEEIEGAVAGDLDAMGFQGGEGGVRSMT